MVKAILDEVQTDFTFVVSGKEYVTDIGDIQHAIASAYASAEKSLPEGEGMSLSRWDSIYDEVRSWVVEKVEGKPVLSRVQVMMLIEAVNLAWEEFKKKSSSTLKSQISSALTPPICPEPGFTPSMETYQDLKPSENCEPAESEAI